MSIEISTAEAAKEVNARFAEMQAKLKRLDAEIAPLKPEAERLRPILENAFALMSEASAELGSIFNSPELVRDAAFEVLSKVEAAVADLVAAIDAECSRDVGPMEAA